MKQKIIRYLRRGSVLAALMVFVIFVTGTSGQTADAQDNRHSSVTGYFGLTDGGFPIVDRHGIMLVFDGAINPETVSTETFEVYLDENTRLDVVDTQVDGAYVFLKLADELPSDATPVVIIAPNEEVEDLAGNATNRRKLGAVRIKDGIAPKLTVTLSGGSGRGTGDVGPDRLTNDTIDIHIASDEPLQTAPRIIVACMDLSWTEDGNTLGIDDLIANRNGPYARKPSEPAGTQYTCGYDSDGEGEGDPFELTEDIALARTGENWEFTWRNRLGDTTALQDGELAVIVYGRDRSRYDRYGETVSNWATATAAFGLDTAFGTKKPAESVRVHPPDGSVVREKRPFVLLEFPTEVAVTLESVTFDDQDIVDEFELVSPNEFVYWPLTMNRGEHRVAVEALDAAGNDVNFEFAFESTQRGDFVLPLVAGWNAVSVPSDPIDPTIEHVFTDPAIEAIISWNPLAIEPWAMSLRANDSWQPWAHGRGVDEIRAGSGYWVKSSEFVEQPIALTHVGLPLERYIYGGCGSTARSWFFVGVTDEEGDQTQNHYGEPLKDHDVVITVREYLGEYVQRAFGWDPIVGNYRKLVDSDAVMIGEGIWYYGSGGQTSCP